MKKLLVLLLPLSLLLTGCSAPAAAFTGLNATLVKIERADDGTLRATLRFSNPNLAVYNVAKSIHRVTLDGKSGAIAIEQPFGLPYSSSVEQTGVLRLEGALAAGRESAAYRMDTTLTILVYGEERQVVKASSSGTVAVAAK